MRHFLAGAACAALLAFAAAGSASAGAITLGESDRKEAVAILADLDHFIERLNGFGEGTTNPLFHGRSLPVPPQECTPKAEPRRFGLLIGAESPGPDQLAMKAALNDVKLLASTLGTVRAKADDIHILTGAAATREGLVDAAWQLLSQVSCGDKVFVYFGGYAMEPQTLAPYVLRPQEAAPSGRTLQDVQDKARNFLNRRLFDTDAAETGLAIRDRAERIRWYEESGLTLFLNGEGVAKREPARELRSFEVMTSADLSELVTLMRNHRADVTVVADTNSASAMALLERQQDAAASFFRADIYEREETAPAGMDNRLAPSPLAGQAGDLAVFYSSVDGAVSVSTGFEVDGQRVQYGLFTFRVAEALLNHADATADNVRAALERIARAADRHRQQVHRVEATRADMRIFAQSQPGQQRTDTIRILEPSGMRGASVMDTPKIDLVGVVDWTSPAKAVLVEGQPATLLGDGRFSATVKLRAGLNTISVMGLTRDDEIHLMPPLEVMFDGDIKKLKGEGRRFALIIANQNYLPETRFSRLATPIADAEALRNVLTERYGFTTELPVGSGQTMPLLLVDATRDQIDETLYTLSQVAGEQDTVLIYYAGHGVYDERTTNAYWVPVNATRPYNYLSGDAITEHIQRIGARSVILISDSCYSGALRSGGGATPPVADVTEEDRQRALLRMAEKRSRILITSGGTEPVMDTGGEGHSIFARALLTGLEQMEESAFSAEELFGRYVRPMVAGRVEQIPQMRPIDKTGHEEAADMVFVRAQTATTDAEIR